MTSALGNQVHGHSFSNATQLGVAPFSVPQFIPESPEGAPRVLMEDNLCLPAMTCSRGGVCRVSMAGRELPMCRGHHENAGSAPVLFLGPHEAASPPEGPSKAASAWDPHPQSSAGLGKAGSLQFPGSLRCPDSYPCYACPSHKILMKINLENERVTK